MWGAKSHTYQVYAAKTNTCKVQELIQIKFMQCTKTDTHRVDE